MAKKKPVAKTAAEIKREIKDLLKMKPTVRRTSLFGDNHHDAIDAQVEVLKDDLTETEIYNRGNEDAEDWKDNVVSAATDARLWMDGEYEDYPRLVDEWKELAGNRPGK